MSYRMVGLISVTLLSLISVFLQEMNFMGWGRERRRRDNGHIPNPIISRSMGHHLTDSFLIPKDQSPIKHSSWDHS